MTSSSEVLSSYHSSSSSSSPIASSLLLHFPASPDDFHLFFVLSPVFADEPDLPHLGLVGNARVVVAEAFGHVVRPLRPAAVGLDEVVAELLLLALSASPLLLPPPIFSSTATSLAVTEEASGL